MRIGLNQTLPQLRQGGGAGFQVFRRHGAHVGAGGKLCQCLLVGGAEVGLQIRQAVLHEHQGHAQREMGDVAALGIQLRGGGQASDAGGAGAFGERVVGGVFGFEFLQAEEFHQLVEQGEGKGGGGSLLGGVLVGAGTGLVIRQQASSGGSDIVAMILNKYSGMPFSYCLMIVDGTIVLSGLLVIGMGLGLNVGSAEPRSWMLSFYSLITMFAIARSIGVVVSGTTDAKLVHIICTPEEGRVLREWILNSLDRTATRSPSYGLYSEQEKEILLLVVRQKELPAITAGVKELAPDCFVVVTDAYDAYGYRWKALPDAGALQIH